jgi:hypothetical protein
MRQLEDFHTKWEVWVGTWLSVVGIVLIGVGGSEMIGDWIRPAMYVAGFLAFLVGAFLIWRDLTASEAHSPARPKGKFLGEFRLNAYFFEAYERDGENGRKEFRLLSSPKMDSEQEAACIRYLVNEGLIEELWPRMSGKIREEAGWAFQG